MLEEIIAERDKKLASIRGAGADPYPASVKRTFFAASALAKFGVLSKTKKIVFLTGRVLSVRKQGGVIFADIKDESGKIQSVFKKETLKNFLFFKENIDIGDFLEISGILFKTKRGEKSVDVKSARIIVKTLRPLPTQWYGLEDQEARLRRRYLDILLHPEIKEMFAQKSVFWREIRNFLLADGFMETETPVLETTPGGADAEPFVTRYNALDSDFYLRISLEISLKKLLVGGFEKIFEIGRVFRNEGMDAEHLQDYTQLEFYAAYRDYRDLMKLTEKMYKTVIKKTFGSLTTKYRGEAVHWEKKWPLVDYCAVFKKETGLDLASASRNRLFEEARKRGFEPENEAGRGRLIDLLYKKLVRPKMIQPCFLIDPPVDIEPLAKRSAKDQSKVERFQIIACGTELGKGFSEANDPKDQRRRFEEQAALREAGDKEAQRLDEEFLEALEYGMPPAAGFGMSERLFAVLVDKPIREIVFFPPMRPPKRES